MAASMATLNVLRLRSSLGPKLTGLVRYRDNLSILGKSFSVTSSCGVNDKLWKLGRLNHVAIAVPDLEKATALYRDVLGAKVSERQALPEHGVYTVFIELGNTKFELLHPLGEKSPIEGFLKKNKSGGMHHVCIEVKNIEEAMKDLKKLGVRLLSETTKIGAHNKPVVFLHPKDCDGVLVELEEE
ncbi:methylmalonyl-CoA epimerase, mitochondrial-like [Tubulanus polymorphus]|uniref:methylmalonyl-CoA epimerase, mitochondrial-like n=1 Tax=Tubulanus polymorphus TaxID=672921 RepID=UPI003DA4445D